MNFKEGKLNYHVENIKKTLDPIVINEDNKKRYIIEYFSESSSKYKAEANNLRIKNNKLSKELKYLFNTCKQSVLNASNSK